MILHQRLRRFRTSYNKLLVLYINAKSFLDNQVPQVELTQPTPPPPPPLPGSVSVPCILFAMTSGGKHRGMRERFKKPKALICNRSTINFHFAWVSSRQSKRRWSTSTPVASWTAPGTSSLSRWSWNNKKASRCRIRASVSSFSENLTPRTAARSMSSNGCRFSAEAEDLSTETSDSSTSERRAWKVVDLMCHAGTSFIWMPLLASTFSSFRCAHAQQAPGVTSTSIIYRRTRAKRVKRCPF